MSGLWEGGAEAYDKGLREELRQRLSVVEGQLSAAISAVERERLLAAIESLKREYSARMKTAATSLF